MLGRGHFGQLEISALLLSSHNVKATSLCTTHAAIALSVAGNGSAGAGAHSIVAWAGGGGTSDGGAGFFQRAHEIVIKALAHRAITPMGFDTGHLFHGCLRHGCGLLGKNLASGIGAFGA